MHLERTLNRWLAAGVIDEAAAGRIREFESRSQPGLRWPMLVALALGGLMMAAGLLLFVAAHWDRLSPAARMALGVGAMAAFHVGGAFASRRLPALSTTLHAIGTVALGGAIYLSGQIFHLEGDWPDGVLLWAVGAWAGWWLLRDWPQTTLTALLTPAWVMGQWKVDPVFALITAFTYLSALHGREDAPWRRALAWIGGIALLPCAVWVAAETRELSPRSLLLVLPLVAAFWMRGRLAWKNAVCALWAVVLALLAKERIELGVLAWCALGSLAMIGWGIEEERTERINLGVAGFAITVLFFYFSHLMDALGRAFSMIVLGVLFLAGGWYLEQLRRKLVARVRTGAS